MAFNGHGGHDFGFQLVRNASLLSVFVFEMAVPASIVGGNPEELVRVRLRAILMERVGAVDIVQAMAGRIAFVLAELQGDITAVYLEGVDITLFPAASRKFGLLLKAAMRLTDAVTALLLGSESCGESGKLWHSREKSAKVLARRLSSCQGPLGHLKSSSTLLGHGVLQLRSDVLSSLSWRPHTDP